ncbi:MAG: asparagine synthase (glutamine-hydrolyzing) [Alphaproteobacteria bacterium]|nr:asparagine synthase (glutamine-hydrolyzing) [Alphaproteobacteria bacterium]
MCGIAGKIDWAGMPGREVVERMVARMVHRGPDAGGVVVAGPAALGHRRLSVIDTRAVADQPMLDAQGDHLIVYNGEVYNFREIRGELEARGAVFRTTSDTEVVLEAYKAWGPDCVRRFNGMFALAVWDKRNRRLFLARDRLGKKPLYWSQLPDGGISFASELTALRADPAIAERLNPRAMAQFLLLNYTLTSECILAGISKLPPAHYLIIEEGRPLQPVRYWDLAACFHDKSRQSRPVAAEELAALLEDAVRLRLVSDVPLGAFLSGGIDSSSIVSAMTRLGNPADVRTFSIGFGESGFDERDEARFTADYLSVLHRDKVVGDEIAAKLATIFAFTDEPFADSSIIPTYAVAELAREHVVVSLSGDGGDELFAGYETYVADKICRLAAWLPNSLVRSADKAFRHLVPPSRAKVGWDEKIRRFLHGMSGDAVSAHASWRHLFTPAELPDLLVPGLAEAVLGSDPLSDFHAFDAEVAGLDVVDRMSYIDIKTWLPDDILYKVDRATMAHALEARAPFLDHRLVEFAARLPPGHKLRGFDKKHVLKLSQIGRIPTRIARRKKAGFSAPVSHWLAREGHGLFVGLTPEILAGDHFRPAAVRRLCEDHWSGRIDNGLKILGLIAFHYWRAGPSAVVAGP